jgi:thiamine phosphate synthase YjbQ (UPF0047 family)
MRSLGASRWQVDVPSPRPTMITRSVEGDRSPLLDVSAPAAAGSSGRTDLENLQMTLFVANGTHRAVGRPLWSQRGIKVPGSGRGFHPITDHVVAALPELGRVAVGLLHAFSMDMSASVTMDSDDELESVVGESVTIPVRDGELLLGPDQAIYLAEQHAVRTPRTLILTLCGVTAGPGVDGGDLPGMIGSNGVTRGGCGTPRGGPGSFARDRA